VESLPSTSKSVPSTGVTAFVFTPDSLKLIMATTSACVLVVDLSPERPRVVRRFEHHRMESARVGRASRVSKDEKAPGAEEAVMDVDTEDSEDEHQDQAVTKEIAMDSQVLRMCVSIDGQWLATTDRRCRTHIFNLDSVQVRILIRNHSMLPLTERSASIILLFRLCHSPYMLWRSILRRQGRLP
jgi:U3 small nucleolar RNA-associated protein 4